MDSQCKEISTYDRRTDSNSTTQRQLIFDRDVDGSYTIYRGMCYGQRAQRSNPRTCDCPYRRQQDETRPLLAYILVYGNFIRCHHERVGSDGNQL